LLLYTRSIIDKIGISAFDRLDRRKHNTSKMLGFEISLLIQIYKKKVKELEQ
jgi:hypothetical protein